MWTTFVRRPVLSGGISILMVLLGLISLQQLPMALFPSVAPPEVNVTVEYTGANAETVTNAALVPLERAITGVPGMKYMSSGAGNDGVGVVQVLFEIGTDPDVAAVNVQNRVNSQVGELPEEVIRNGVKIAREENAKLLYLSLSSENDEHDEHDEKFLYNFADINLLAELKRIPGVGFADILGAKEHAIRVWLRPDLMTRYDVAAEEVLEALQAANVEAAPGKIGENSDQGDTPLQYTLKYTGKFSEVEQYARIPLRAGPDGELLRVEDVADVALGTMCFDIEARLDGRPAASILLKQAPGSNAREVISAVKARMAELERSAFLPSMRITYGFDGRRFIDASMHEVQKTLVEAFALVVFLFLGDRRALLISVGAVPVSLIGTLTFLQLFGFSLNLITLFALVLAIGIVVDNAIVVVEAVHHRMTHGGLDGRAATGAAIVEIAPAIIGITLVMGSVFVPMAFLSGPAGIFYRQFAVTMAFAIALSGVLALTRTPAMCGALMRPPAAGAAPAGRVDRLLARFEAAWGRVEARFTGLVTAFSRRRSATTAALIAFTAAQALVGRLVPGGFIPGEDQGVFYVSITSPAGSTLERTKAVVDAVAAAARELPDVESVASLSGTNVLSDGTARPTAPAS